MKFGQDETLGAYCERVHTFVDVIDAHREGSDTDKLTQFRNAELAKAKKHKPSIFK